MTDAEALSAIGRIVDRALVSEPGRKSRAMANIDIEAIQQALWEIRQQAKLTKECNRNTLASIQRAFDLLQIGDVAPASAAVTDVLAERRRQVEEEGWALEHDDQHRNGELLEAANIYLFHDPDRASPSDLVTSARLPWPWGTEWFKPKTRRENLVRAGALCMAEIERLIRRRNAGNQLSRGRTSTIHVQHRLDQIIAEIERLDRASLPTAPARGVGG